MARTYNFGGRSIVRPGSYTKRSFPKQSSNGSQTGSVILVGEAAKGGIPYNGFSSVEDIINTASDIDQAMSITGGGDIYYGVEFFLTPTKDERFQVPEVAKFIIVNQMTQAAGAIKAAGAVSIIDLKSRTFGTNGNQVSFKIEAGSNVGKLLRVLYKGIEILKTDDLIIPMLSIQYVGSGSAATLTINGTTLSTTITGGGASDALNLTLADYSDLGSLINKINSNPAYVCSLTGKSDELVSIFDAVTAQDIRTTAYSASAIVESIIRAINATDYVVASLTDSAARTVPANMTAFDFLTGGTVSVATNNDWIAVLKKLEKIDVDNIVCVSGSSAIHSLFNEHVEKMNDIKTKKYRQWGSGAGSAVNTKALRIAELKSLNSAYAEYCISPFKRYDYVNGKIPSNDFDPYLMYPMISGFRYANNVGMDVVFKYLNILSTPEMDDGDIDDYGKAGATFVQKTNNILEGSQNFEIIVNNTTYQGDQVTRTNPACVYEINKLTKDYEAQVIEKIRALDGVADSLIIATIQNWITTFLFPKYRDDYKWITDSIAEDGTPLKAFDNVLFSQNGEQFITKAKLTMSVTPRYAFNFFTFVVPGQKA